MRVSPNLALACATVVGMIACSAGQDEPSTDTTVSVRNTRIEAIAGGVAKSQDNRFSIDFPAGAFSEDVTVQVTQQSSQLAPAVTLTKAYKIRFVPEEATVAYPLNAEVAVTLSRNDVDRVGGATSLRLAHGDEIADPWFETLSGTWDDAEQRFSAVTGSLSYFLLFDSVGYGSCSCDETDICNSGCQFCDPDCISTGECNGNSDCDAGESCVDGTCMTLCSSIEDCGSCEMCSDLGVCLYDPSCGSTCTCDFTSGLCDEDCACDFDCSACWCNTAWGCDEGCECDEECVGCTCDYTTGVCDEACSCDQDCIDCWCNLSSLCDEGCLCDDTCGYECEYNSDCGFGEICVDYYCIPGCAYDEDCGDCELCDLGSCVEDPTCNTCTCDYYSGTCEQGCTCDQDCITCSCNYSTSCDSGCACDTDCPVGGGGANTGAGCVEDANCPGGACFGGRCYDYCYADGSCLTDFTCSSGYCIALCVGDSDCGSGGCCLGGWCTYDDACIAGCTCDVSSLCDPSCNCDPNCSSGSCAAGEWQCNDGACIVDVWRCDRYSNGPDCADGSDEDPYCPVCSSTADCPSPMVCDSASGRCWQGG